MKINQSVVPCAIFANMEGVNQRQMEIIAKVNEKGFVKVSDLSNELHVSLVTIRKDLAFLESKGLLYRTHGGASKQSIYTYERSVREKENIRVNQKKEIALKAKNYIDENDSIILASGTTILYLADLLSDFKALSVVTASLRVALTLSDTEHIEVVHLGGVLRKSSMSVAGSIAERNMNSFSCNKLFIGVDGIDLKHGLTTSNDSVANLNRTMIQSSDHVIVLSDSSKIGKHSLCKIAALEEIHTIITDSDILEEQKQAIEDLGIELVIV